MVFNKEQLERIAKSFPGPSLEAATGQFESDFGAFAPEKDEFIVRHGMLVEKWNRFGERRDMKSLEKFFEEQGRLDKFHEKCWGGATHYYEPLGSSAVGVRRAEAESEFVSEKARKGLKELEAREEDLVLQFRMR
jgi:hypothetical protein